MTLGRSIALAIACLQGILPVTSTLAVTMKGQYFNYPKTKGDSVAEHRQLRRQEAEPNAVQFRSYEPIVSADIASIPVPHAMPSTAKTLNLHEAIALALRNNPDVKVAEMQRIIDKFGLETAIWSKYEPQITPLTITSSLQKNLHPTWQLGTGVSVYSPTGTTATLGYTNNLLGGIGTSNLTIKQELLKGFGLALNRIDYDNAIDSELSARLTFKNSIITAVLSVITSYRTLVQAYNTLQTSEQSLRSQEVEVDQSKLKVKAGKMAPSDLLQQEQNLESRKLDVVQQKDSLRDSYQSFLSTLGLAASTKLIVDKHISTQDVRVPSQKQAIKIALDHNISYQQALISLRQTKRALLQAEDARKWTLEMTGSVQLGSQASVANGPVISQNQNPTLGFSLSIPINDLTLKSNLVSAKVALESAKIKLAQQKEDLIRNVINQLDSIKNQYQQIKISKLSVELQQKTLDNAKLKLKYGQATVFEVNSLTNDLVSQQIGLISTEIAYLNAVSSFYNTLGITLDEWAIKLRY